MSIFTYQSTLCAGKCTEASKLEDLCPACLIEWYEWDKESRENAAQLEFNFTYKDEPSN